MVYSKEIVYCKKIFVRFLPILVLILKVTRPQSESINLIRSIIISRSWSTFNITHCVIYYTIKVIQDLSSNWGRIWWVKRTRLSRFLDSKTTNWVSYIWTSATEVLLRSFPLGCPVFPVLDPDWPCFGSNGGGTTVWLISFGYSRLQLKPISWVMVTITECNLSHFNRIKR